MFSDIGEKIEDMLLVIPLIVIVCALVYMGIGAATASNDLKERTGQLEKARQEISELQLKLKEANNELEKAIQERARQREKAIHERTRQLEKAQQDIIELQCKLMEAHKQGANHKSPEGSKQ